MLHHHRARAASAVGTWSSASCCAGSNGCAQRAEAGDAVAGQRLLQPGPDELRRPSRAERRSRAARPPAATRARGRRLSTTGKRSLRSFSFAVAQHLVPLLLRPLPVVLQLGRGAEVAVVLVLEPLQVSRAFSCDSSSCAARLFSRSVSPASPLGRLDGHLGLGAGGAAGVWITLDERSASSTASAGMSAWKAPFCRALWHGWARDRVSGGCGVDRPDRSSWHMASGREQAETAVQHVLAIPPRTVRGRRTGRVLGSVADSARGDLAARSGRRAGSPGRSSSGSGRPRPACRAPARRGRTAPPPPTRREPRRTRSPRR